MGLPLIHRRSADKTPPNPRVRHEWEPGDRGQLGVICFSHAVQHFYPAALAVSYPFIVESLHISYGTLGVVLGIAGVLGGVLQGVAGFFEKVSARVLLSAQNLALAVSIALAGLAPGFTFFGAARCVGAIASWPQHPIGNSLLVRRFPTRRAFALSSHTAGGSIGTAVIPLIATALIAAFGWRWELVLIATPMALGGFLVMARLRDIPPSEHDVDLGREGSLAATVRLRDVITRRQVFGALAAGTVAAAGRGLGALNTYVPAYLRTGLRLQTLTVGVVFTVIVIGSIAGPIVAGLVSDRMGRSRVLASVYLVGAAMMVLFVLVGASLLGLLVVGVLLGAFAYSESPLLQAVFSEGTEGAPVRAAFGLYFAISYGVGALWLPLLGYIIDTAGFHVAFFSMACSFVLASLIVLASRPVPTAEPRGRDS